MDERGEFAQFDPVEKVDDEERVFNGKTLAEFLDHLGIPDGSADDMRAHAPVADDDPWAQWAELSPAELENEDDEIEIAEASMSEVGFTGDLP